MAVRKVKETIEVKNEKKPSNFLTKLSQSLFNFVLNIINLNNTGKVVSITVISLVMVFFHKFLSIHDFSIEAMKVVVPALTQLSGLVFGVIGGAKAANNIASKIIDMKTKAIKKGN